MSAGPGWGLLAVTADLATGVLPVALATVTWSWGAGWAAGLGAVTGACWPALGRRPGGHGVVVLAGAAFALAPPAGILSLLPALAVLGVARLLGRNGLVAATAVGFGTYPFLFLAAYRDPLRLAALMGLYLVAGLRYVTTRRGRSGKADRRADPADWCGAAPVRQRRPAAVGSGGLRTGSGGRMSPFTACPATATLHVLEVPVSSLSLFRRRDPWWESDGPAARRERRHRRFVGGLAFMASLVAIAAAAFAWSIELGLAAGMGIHASLPLG